MRRTRSDLCFTFPLALLFGAAIATTMPSAPVFAETWTEIDSNLENNGDITILQQDKDDGHHYFLWTYKANGKVEGHDFYSEFVFQDLIKGDPGPDGTTQRIEKPDVAGMLKKARGLMIHISASVKEGTPLAGWLESEGRGGIIRWNPADDSDKGGPGQAPKGHAGGLTPKQIAAIAKNINFTAKSLAAIGNSMGDGVDGLAGESTPTPNKSGGRGKGTSDGTGGGSDNKNKWRHGGEVVTLGPRPDLVNPAPKNRTRSSRPAIFRAPIRSGVPGANLR